MIVAAKGWAGNGLIIFIRLLHRELSRNKKILFVVAKNLCRNNMDIAIMLGVVVVKTEWVYCPVCSGKTRTKVRMDTVMINYPLYCPKCGKETLVRIENNKITMIKEPDAKTQSR